MPSDPNVTLLETDAFQVVVDVPADKEKVVTKSGPIGPIGPTGPVGATGATGADGTMTAQQLLNLELHLAFKLANITNFKETTFASGLMTNLSIYTNSSKAVKLFDKALSYNVGQLITIVITRITDSATLTKNLLYNPDGTLLSVDTI